MFLSKFFYRSNDIHFFLNFASNLPKPLRSEIRLYIDPPPLRGSAPTDFPVGTEGADKQDNFAAARPQESINPAGHSRIRRLERPLPPAILKPFPAKRLNVSPSGHLPDSSAFLSFGRDRAAGIESIEDHVQRFYFPFGRVVKIFMANRESGKWDFLLSLSLVFLFRARSSRKKIQFPRTYDCWPFLCLKFFLSFGFFFLRYSWDKL